MGKQDYLLNIGLHETRWGTCKGKTSKGKPCRHQVIYANGYCAQHGGVTSDKDKAEQLKIAKEKLQKRIKRADKKWPERLSNSCSPTGPATHSTSTGNHAAVAKSSSANQASIAASGTAGTLSIKLARAQKRVSEEHSQTSPDLRQNKDSSEHSPISKKAGDDHKTKHKTAPGKESESQSNKALSDQSADTRDKHHPSEGDCDNARASASVPLTGYSRGNRGDPWRVVGVDKLGRQLVEVPSWSGWSVPRGVDGPHLLNDWQGRPYPPRHLVDPKTYQD